VRLGCSVICVAGCTVVVCNTATDTGGTSVFVVECAVDVDEVGSTRVLDVFDSKLYPAGRVDSVIILDWSVVDTVETGPVIEWKSPVVDVVDITVTVDLINAGKAPVVVEFSTVVVDSLVISHSVS
jgi:hypothetical protein